MFLIGFISGILVTILTIVFLLSSKLFLVRQSKLDFNKTIEAFEKIATDNNWGIQHKYDLQATLKGKGFDIQPTTVISMCKPGFAQEILNNNKTRHISALLPCRVAVYVKGDKTYISVLNTLLFSKVLNNESKKVMRMATVENMKIIDQLAKN